MRTGAPTRSVLRWDPYAALDEQLGHDKKSSRQCNVEGAKKKVPKGVEISLVECGSVSSAAVMRLVVVSNFCVVGKYCSGSNGVRLQESRVNCNFCRKPE